MVDFEPSIPSTKRQQTCLIDWKCVQKCVCALFKGTIPAFTDNSHSLKFATKIKQKTLFPKL